MQAISLVSNWKTGISSFRIFIVGSKLYIVQTKNPSRFYRGGFLILTSEESEGFEPSISLTLYTLSKRASSATRATLHFTAISKIPNINAVFNHLKTAFLQLVFLSYQF